MADDKSKKKDDDKCTCEGDEKDPSCPVHGKDAKAGKKGKDVNPLAMWAKGRE